MHASSGLRLSAESNRCLTRLSVSRLCISMEKSKFAERGETAVTLTNPSLPRRVFLDTNVVNFVLDHGECIFDGGTAADDLSVRDRDAIDCLHRVFIAGQRGGFELAISHKTYDEISRTRDSGRRGELLDWFNELWLYWRDIANEDDTISTEAADRLAHDPELGAILSCFPDQADRELIAHALAFKCDAFCTLDQRTILNHVHRLAALDLEFLSPRQWWARIEPWV